MPKVLIANRGEIAIRILRSAQELGWTTVAVYTENDESHAAFADEAVKIEAVSDFLNVDRIVGIALNTQCTHLHPGYGFLSENPTLALQSQSNGISFVGPSAETLRTAGDKMLSRDLAASLAVPIAPGRHVASGDDVRAFAQTVAGAGAGGGYPVMIKALDGGGGRGIRVVDGADGVEEAFKRCLGESPSGQLFAEKALTGPDWKHIEVQMVGDGTGDVRHLWERECSVQRRFQKIVEMAPSTLFRNTVWPLLDASLQMARHLKYKGLGTFEYLVNSRTNEWVFLEINPRVQVEHTVTEEITNLDLVRIQLLLSLPSPPSLKLLVPSSLPIGHAIQLRLTAEDTSRAFQLSTGTIRAADIAWPSGRGVRIDTWLSASPRATELEWIVGPDFDSLLAKVIVHGNTFEEATQRAKRALRELHIGGEVKTNSGLLAGVVGHRDWLKGTVDTMWLERNVEEIVRLGNESLDARKSRKGDHGKTGSGSSASSSSVVNVLLQPGSLFHLTLSPTDASGRTAGSTKHTLTLSSIAHNSFPDHLSGTLQTTLSPSAFNFDLTQSSFAAISSASFELADPNNLTHVGSPLTGKIVELHPALLAVDNPDASHFVKKGDTLAVLSVMKMESVVPAPRSGVVERKGKGMQVGAVVGEGVLIGVIGGRQDASDVNEGAKSRL